MKRTFGWHFVGERLHNGEPIPPDGKWLIWKGPLVMCTSGLHVGITPWDALQYAPGSTLCFIEYGGEMFSQADKHCCRRRRIIARMDATEMLRYFARMRALSVSHLWADTDDLNDLVLDYFMTGNPDTRVSAWASARDSARDSAWASARESAWASARDSAWASARNEFNALVYECFEGPMRGVNFKP